MLDRVAEAHDIKPDVLAADKGYGTGPFLAWLEGTRGYGPYPGAGPAAPDAMRSYLPREAFTFDPERNVFICPQGKILKHRTRPERQPHSHLSGHGQRLQSLPYQTAMHARHETRPVRAVR